MKDLVVFGASGFAKEVAWLASSLGHSVRAFIDLRDGESIENIPVRSQDFFDLKKHRVVLGVGSPQLREKIVKSLPFKTEFVSLIHPSVQMSPSVKVGEGSVICANCVLTCNIELGAFAQLNLGTTVGHDVRSGNFFTTAPLVSISGNCSFGERVYFGTHSSTIEGVKICDDVLIGAAACVVKDIVESGTYIGMPAKKLERKK